MLIKGAAVAANIDENTKAEQEKLILEGRPAKLAVIRMGEKPDDIFYEKSALKRAQKLGVLAECVHIDADAAQSEVEEAVARCSDDESVTGILLLRPLSKHIDENAVIAHIAPNKDIDGITPGSLAGVFMGRESGFAPCTAEACVRVIEHYVGDITGKNAVIIGRSLVVGKPLAMLLLKKNATVTVCHTRTRDLKGTAKNADILIAAAGRAKMVDAEYVREGQTVIDVGINADENGNMVGDVDMDSVEPVAGMLTPVPGGVGSVTTSVLLANTVEAAKRRA